MKEKARFEPGPLEQQAGMKTMSLPQQLKTVVERTHRLILS
jgi:hypothetical protein